MIYILFSHGGDSKQGTVTPKTKDDGFNEKDKKRTCKRKAPACDTNMIKEDKNNPGTVDQELLCKAGVSCQISACGWLGGTCEIETIKPPIDTYLPPPPTTPKNTYLPPSKGY